MASVIERLSDQFGDDLRSVGYYDDDGTEIEYIRDDIASEYENGDLDRVFRDAKLEAIDHPHQESLYVHGNLDCTLRCFEEATELHFVQDETEGIVVAVDAGAIDHLRETIGVCLEAIDDS